ncbi:DUF3140 domain-containing protein [Actinopolymorpha sp. B17G11]|uniref:DUF3140 domain-containing protein n=2 Tax=unclassified Actinopolymorpha TaxID=2627063 RepID=UPI0032E379F9
MDESHPRPRLAAADSGRPDMVKSSSVDAIWNDWKAAVNMTAKELERWLATEKSQSVGQRRDGGESTGHESGRKIVTLLGKNKNELTDEDVDHMRKVVGYVKRHLAQRPAKDVTESRWRYSLMNWGHDPLKH